MAEIADDPEVRQLLLLDAPRVLGWAEFRDISLGSSLGLTEQLLTEVIDAGQLKPQPTRPLATIVLGALDEAAMSIANADDPDAERAALRAVIHDLIDGLLLPGAADRGEPPSRALRAHAASRRRAAAASRCAAIRASVA